MSNSPKENVQQPEKSGIDPVADRMQRDLNYAVRFFSRADEGMKEQMKQGILGAVKTGVLSLVVNINGLTELNKEKMSAYRYLADQMGFVIGQFKRTESTAQASIQRKIEK